LPFGQGMMFRSSDQSGGGPSHDESNSKLISTDQKPLIPIQYFVGIARINGGRATRMECRYILCNLLGRMLVRNLCTADGESDAKSILWGRGFAKERRSSELSWHIVFTSSGGVYGHLHLDFDRL
jgi:hypothetical protein